MDMLFTYEKCRFTNTSAIHGEFCRFQTDVITLKSSCKSRAKEMLTLSRGLTAASPLLCPLVCSHTLSQGQGLYFTLPLPRRGPGIQDSRPQLSASYGAHR